MRVALMVDKWGAKMAALLVDSWVANSVDLMVDQTVDYLAGDWDGNWVD